MIKAILTFLILSISLLGFSQVNSKKVAGNERIVFLREKITDGGKSPYTMIVAHRGDWRNAPENSLEAFQNCIDAGIDAIELDVRETKDGELVIMHDLTLDRTTNGKGKVSDFTLEELNQLKLRSGHGYITTHKIPTFTEALLLLKGKALIFADKWQPVADKIIDEASSQNCLDQVVVWEKIASVGDFQLKYKPTYKEIIYIPLIIFDGKKDEEKLSGILKQLPEEIKIVGVGFVTDTLEVINHFGKTIKSSGKRILMFSSDPNISGGRNDDLAVHDINTSYKWLSDKGVNIFFTDRPFLLNSYLEKEGKRDPNWKR